MLIFHHSTRRRGSYLGSVQQKCGVKSGQQTSPGAGGGGWGSQTPEDRAEPPQHGEFMMQQLHYSGRKQLRSLVWSFVIEIV